jgi:hypothetical protein
MNRKLLVIVLVGFLFVLQGCTIIINPKETPKESTVIPTEIDEQTSNVREFEHDGTFLAYELSVRTNNTPQVVFVSVTIENDKIVGYQIDTRQGRRVQNTETQLYSFSWNALTKRELGNDYNMKNASAIGKEWFEQAEAIEAFWLANGLDAVEVNAEGYITNITGASMSDAYTAVAKKAVENAKAGKYIAIYTSITQGRPELYIAEMKLNKMGKIETLMLDVLQSTINTATGVMMWNPKSNQELGNDYGMKGAGGYAFVGGAWVAQGTCTLEWYEQVALITNYIKANGWSNSLQPVAQRSGSLNGITVLPSLAGATIRTSNHFSTLKLLFIMAGDSVK